MKQFFVINKYTLVIIFLFISFSLPAQVPPAPDGGGGPGSANDVVPINMYWFILLATGAYYGIKKIR